MKSKLFLTASCLLLFAAIGQAQQNVYQNQAPIVVYPTAVYSVALHEAPPEGFVIINGNLVRIPQQSNDITVGLWAPDEFVVGTSPQMPYGAPQGGYVPAPLAVPPTQEELQKMQMMEAMSEQMEAASHKAMVKGMVRSVWNGQGANLMTFAGISNEPAVAALWGISEAQLEQIEERMNSTFEQMGDPMEAAMLNLAAEMNIPLDENGMAPDGWEPDLETMMKMQANMQDIMESSVETIGLMVNTAIADAFDEFLTPQQLQTIQESQLANMEILPFSPSAFEALDLSDAQREQMEQIRQELEPDFETMLDSWVDGFIAMENRLDEEYSKERAQWEPLEMPSLDYTELWKQYSREFDPAQDLAPGEVVMPVMRNDGGEPTLYVIDLAAFEAKMKEEREAIAEASRSRPSRDDMRKKLLAEDPEYKRLSEEMQSKSKAFAGKFQTQMFDVLTDEQWLRLQQLIAHPPEHALAFRKALRETFGIGDESEKREAVAESHVSEKPGMWIPGPGAWQPGSSVIPEGNRMERNIRFPRGTE